MNKEQVHYAVKPYSDFSHGLSVSFGDIAALLYRTQLQGNYSDTQQCEKGVSPYYDLERGQRGRFPKLFSAPSARIWMVSSCTFSS